jgi:hypothetical protein
MIPIYNQYIKPTPYTNYISEIAIINTKNTIIKKDIFYIEGVDDSPIKSGFYSDNNDYLLNLYFNSQYAVNNNILKSINYTKKYFTYIKVIEDLNNPQLNGQVMIFSFGRTLFNVFSSHGNIFNKTFRIKVNIKNGFPDYSNCDFTNKNVNIFDNNLNLDSEIFYKKINIESIIRKEKLEKIINNINEIEKWICE